MLTRLKKFFKILRTNNYSYFINRLLHRQYLIQWVPTVRCNLRCSMCHQKDIRVCREKELTHEEILIMLKNFKKLKINQINLVGGEFFVRSDAWKILDKIEDMGFLFSIGTNATLLSEGDVAKLSYYWGLVELDVSVDGADAKTHDTIRGVDGAFDKTVDFIKNCKSYDITVMVVTVVQAQNYKKLKDIADLLKKLNIDTWTIVQEFSINEKTLTNTKEVLQILSKKPVTIFASQSIYPRTFKYDLEDFKKEIYELQKYTKDLKLKTNFSFDVNKFDSIYNETCQTDYKCSCNNFAGQVDWQGNLNFCPFIRVEDLQKAHGLIDKNFLKQKDIYRLKEKVLKSNMMHFCERCCGLILTEKKNN